jgi:AcrR family transcriptional regulator
MTGTLRHTVVLQARDVVPPAPEVLPEGRRERKKRVTRLALKAAALDLVAERGFANVTVEDIADAVDVSIRTFFNYFSSKEAAIVGHNPEMVDSMVDELIGLPPELSPLEALREVLFQPIVAIGEDIDLSGESRAVWLRRFAVVRSQPEVMLAYAKHTAMLEQALTNAMLVRLGGEARLRLYASAVTACAMGVMKMAAISWAGEGGTTSLLATASGAFEMLANGFAFPTDQGPLAPNRDA